MLLDEIASRLVGQGVGLLGVTIFLGSAANLPKGGCLSIIETGGTSAARTHNDTATERPTLQFKARHENLREASAMLMAAYNALGGANGLYNIELNGVFYLSIIARQSPTDTGQDAAGRATYSFNVDIEKQPS